MIRLRSASKGTHLQALWNRRYLLHQLLEPWLLPPLRAPLSMLAPSAEKDKRGGSGGGGKTKTATTNKEGNRPRK